MPSKTHHQSGGPTRESWLLLAGSALVLVLFFVKLYAVLSPRLIAADTDLAAHKAIVLEPGIDKSRLQSILAAENYFPDPRDLQLVTDSLAAKLNQHGAPANLGELNKKKWLIAVPAAWNPAGTGVDFRERLLASRQRLGFDSVVYNRELTRPPALGATISAGKGKRSVEGKVEYEDKPVQGVLVELRQHIAGEEEQPLPIYSRTDGEGRFRFNGLLGDSGYSVLPLKPGFEFGSRQGTASLTEDRSFLFRMQPHRMRLIGSISFGQIKEDNLLLVRTPDTFSRNYWMILWIHWRFFLYSYTCNAKAVDAFLLPVLLLLSGISLLMLLCIQHPLTDTFLSFQTLQGLLAGLLGFAVLAGTKPGKLYTRWWYDPLFNFRRRDVFGLKGFSWLVAALFLAVVTLVFGTGPEGSGVKVNLQIAGILFQPSEITKYLLLVFMAGFFAANEHHLRHISDSRNRFMLSFLLMAGVAGLLALYLLMGDMGPALVVCFSFLVFYSMARGNLLLMLGAAVLYGLLLVFLPAVTATAIAFIAVLTALVLTGAAQSSTGGGVSPY
ncbi:MAG: FtsW/RodA/SpoVE family cell cycle protein [Flavihumibacter sp.]